MVKFEFKIIFHLLLDVHADTAESKRKGNGKRGQKKTNKTEAKDQLTFYNDATENCYG